MNGLSNMFNARYSIPKTCPPKSFEGPPTVSSINSFLSRYVTFDSETKKPLVFRLSNDRSNNTDLKTSRLFNCHTIVHRPISPSEGEVWTHLRVEPIGVSSIRSLSRAQMHQTGLESDQVFTFEACGKVVKANDTSPLSFDTFALYSEQGKAILERFDSLLAAESGNFVLAHSRDISGQVHQLTAFIRTDDHCETPKETIALLMITPMREVAELSPYSVQLKPTKVASIDNAEYHNLTLLVPDKDLVSKTPFSMVSSLLSIVGITSPSGLP